MYKFKTLIDLTAFWKPEISKWRKPGFAKSCLASYGDVSKRIFIFTFCLVMFSPKLNAQKSISIEKTIEYINGKFGGEYVIQVNYGALVATYFEGGEKYREDQVNVKDLSADKVTFNPQTKMLLLNCKGGKDGKCVTREFLNKRLYYNRVSFVLKTNQSAATGLTKAFKHLIRSINEKNYESAEPFE